METKFIVKVIEFPPGDKKINVTFLVTGVSPTDVEAKISEFYRKEGDPVEWDIRSIVASKITKVL